MSFMDSFIKSNSPKVKVAVTSGKKLLNMGLFSNTLEMSVNDDGYLVFSSGTDLFEVKSYQWGGSVFSAVTETTTTGNDKTKEKHKKKGRLVGAAVGTALLGPAGTLIGAMTGTGNKKVKGKTKRNSKSTTTEKMIETSTTAVLTVKNITSQQEFSFGFECNSNINIDVLNVLNNANTVEE